MRIGCYDLVIVDTKTLDPLFSLILFMFSFVKNP